MTKDCFTAHAAYLKEWKNGISVCLLCAAKHEMAVSAKAGLLKASLEEKKIDTHSLSIYHGEEREGLLNKNKCPKCSSTLVYFRLKLMEFICRGCGHSWKKKHVDTHK